MSLSNKKNNLSTFNLFFLFFFTFSFLLLFLCIFFPSHFPSNLWLCLVLGKCERKKIGRKNGREEKGKEMNINFFHLFGYPWKI